MEGLELPSLLESLSFVDRAHTDKISRALGIFFKMLSPEFKILWKTGWQCPITTLRPRFSTPASSTEASGFQGMPSLPPLQNTATTITATPPHPATYNTARVGNRSCPQMRPAMSKDLLLSFWAIFQ